MLLMHWVPSVKGKSEALAETLSNLKLENEEKEGRSNRLQVASTLPVAPLVKKTDSERSSCRGLMRKELLLRLAEAAAAAAAAVAAAAAADAGATEAYCFCRAEDRPAIDCSLVRKTATD
ncbi:hypothetical protein Emag_002173 [Eimeria magna]